MRPQALISILSVLFLVVGSHAGPLAMFGPDCQRLETQTPRYSNALYKQFQDQVCVKKNCKRTTEFWKGLIKKTIDGPLISGVLEDIGHSELRHTIDRLATTLIKKIDHKCIKRGDDFCKSPEALKSVGHCVQSNAIGVVMGDGNAAGELSVLASNEVCKKMLDHLPDWKKDVSSYIKSNARKCRHIVSCIILQ